jgi:hypothetical protein
MRVSTSKLLNFACPLANRGCFQCPVANFVYFQSLWSVIWDAYNNNRGYTSNMIFLSNQIYIKTNLRRSIRCLVWSPDLSRFGTVQKQKLSLQVRLPSWFSLPLTNGSLEKINKPRQDGYSINGINFFFDNNEIYIHTKQYVGAIGVDCREKDPAKN